MRFFLSLQLLFLVTISLSVQPTWAQEQAAPPLIRQPALDPEGNILAFSYQGDLWIHHLEKQYTRRLTVHQAYDAYPVFSPDGERIAFQSNRFGNEDLFAIDIQGGTPQQLTYHPADDHLTDWTQEGEILFTTERIFNTIEWDPEVWAIPDTGGTPTRILQDFGEMVCASPDGRYLALARGSCRMSREGYQGPAANNIWIYDRLDSNYHQLSHQNSNDLLPRWKDDSLLYLHSNGEHYQLVSQAIREGKAQDSLQVELQDPRWGIRYYDHQAGYTVALRGTEVLLQRNNGPWDTLNLSLPSDYHFFPEEDKTYRDAIRNYEVSPSGKQVAFQVRGEVFVKNLESDEPQSVNLSQHPYYDRELTWLNDSLLLFSSDRNGKYRFYQLQSADPAKTDLFQSLRHQIEVLDAEEGNLRHPLLAPNGEWLAYQIDDQKLVVARIDDQGNLSDQRTLVDAWHGASGLNWSPDSRYLAYHRADLNFNREVYIQSIAENSEPINVSMHPGNDYNPQWSPDGSKLAFISDRNDDDSDLWFAWLRQEDWLQAQEEREEGYYFDDEESQDTTQDQALDLDLEGIYKRLEQVTSLEGNESHYAIAPDGESFYFTRYNPLRKGRDLYSIKYDGSELKELTDNGPSPNQLQWGPKHKKLYFNSKGKLQAFEPQSGKVKRFPHQAKLTIHHPQERQQVMDEAWSLLDQRFYDPQFHGQDWEQLREQYAPLIHGASTDQDFRYAFNWMAGQLNASHMGLYGSNPEQTQSNPRHLLGMEVQAVEEGVQITSILPKSPAARQHHDLQTGDIITTVNGQELPLGSNFYRSLSRSDRDQILLGIQDGSGQDREVVIRPTGSLSSQRYDAWVKQKRQLVEEWSDGKLGYLHIRGMDMRSFERFERELMVSGHGKEGIVIDVRYNGGGWTTDYLLAVLSVRQHAYTIPRGATDNLQKNHAQFSQYYPYSERLPLASWTRHAITLCNSSSYSNAEIFSHAFKSLDLGPLVGSPTFGAVISTGGASLLDGSFVRLPFRGWYVKATGQNMENGPAVPDILVPQPPATRAQNRDPQLRRSVNLLLKDLPEASE